MADFDAGVARTNATPFAIMGETATLADLQLRRWKSSWPHLPQLLFEQSQNVHECSENIVIDLTRGPWQMSIDTLMDALDRSVLFPKIPSNITMTQRRGDTNGLRHTRR